LFDAPSNSEERKFHISITEFHVSEENVFIPDDGINMLSQIFDNQLPTYTPQHPTRAETSSFDIITLSIKTPVPPCSDIIHTHAVKVLSSTPIPNNTIYAEHLHVCYSAFRKGAAVKVQKHVNNTYVASVMWTFTAAEVYYLAFQTSLILLKSQAANF
jgi:hypothetical protein